jgi:hypothetical protein
MSDRAVRMKKKKQERNNRKDSKWQVSRNVCTVADMP